MQYKAAVKKVNKHLNWAQSLFWNFTAKKWRICYQNWKPIAHRSLCMIKVLLTQGKNSLSLYAGYFWGLGCVKRSPSTALQLSISKILRSLFSFFEFIPFSTEPNLFLKINKSLFSLHILLQTSLVLDRFHGSCKLF